MSKDGSALPALLLVSVVSFFVYICVAILISHYKDYQNIKQGRFYVVTDELIGKQEAESYPTRFLWAFSQPAKLTFYAYGTFIPISNHTFDNPDLYAVSDTDNYISSSIGDKFLLVINKKSNILLVYNTKQFEYHDSLQKSSIK